MTTQTFRPSSRKRIVTRILRSNEHLAWAWWHVRVRLAELRERDSIIVYQMGKVGSSTIVASLRALQRKFEVHHVHTLTKQGLAAEEAVYRELGQHSTESMLRKTRHLMSGRYLQQRIRRRAHDKRWKVITLVREPIARNISSFFQMIEYHLPNFMDRYNAGELDITTVIKVFLEEFDHDHALQWFHTDLLPSLGIDIYTSDFPKDEGYKMYEGETCELLLIKLEKLDECAQAAFSEFLDIDDFTLIKSNVSEEKEYARAYQEFKERLILPSSYIEKMYSSQYVQHFYSPSEIAAFANKWKLNHEVFSTTTR